MCAGGDKALGSRWLAQRQEGSRTQAGDSIPVEGAGAAVTCGLWGWGRAEAGTWLLTGCLLPNRASFAPACLSHEIIIRRSVSPSPRTARVYGSHSKHLQCPHPQQACPPASPALASFGGFQNHLDNPLCGKNSLAAMPSSALAAPE